MKKFPPFPILYLLLMLFITAGCDPVPVVVPEVVRDLEWFYLADMECLCQGGEEVASDKFLEQLLALSDTELINVLSNGDEFIDAARPYSNELVTLKRDRLERQHAFRFWRRGWPAEFSLEIRGRDNTLSPAESFLITTDKIYLLWPFNISTSDLENRWNMRTASLFNPDVLPYVADEHLLGSSLFNVLDNAIESETDPFKTNVKACQDDFDSHQDPDQLHTCITDEIDRFAGAGTLNYPPFLRFSARVDSPLVSTLLHRPEPDRLALMISPNASAGDPTGPIPEYPCGRFDP